MWVTLLVKNEGETAIKSFKASPKAGQSWRKLRLLRRDRGGEFTATTFTSYCAYKSIGRQLTAPELHRGTTKSDYRCHGKDLDEAEGCASEIVGYKPDVSHLRVFGCVMHVKVMKPHVTKLNDQSSPMVFLGYEPGSVVYFVYNLLATTFISHRHCVDHKPIGLKWVFKLKRNANSNVLKHKGRLDAKGYVQRHGVNFDEGFAPVARLEFVCL
ncbi:hypothetical protein AXG93_2145s1760 [Marchantia polymorpha subsp. ruderalis]|uniref:Reverse transcriptase Ty1/copia-type domain-containing protein n=1 Tax=Marchantia polymorpha subsp. ruderalis TaxID=1480154 RepID=A0A176VYQ3_MARPO|nr:hypothetical protein AXG93_2145s1760 [Marchantia polymorpha subsp. ruderalis]